MQTISWIELRNVAGLTSNNSLYLGGVAAASYQLNSTLAANVAGMTANNSTNFAGQGQAYYANITNPVFSNNITISSNNNKLIYLNSANDTYQASIVFSSNNINKWELGQQSGNSYFYIWNYSLSTNPLTIYLANNLVQIANSLSVGTSVSSNVVINTAGVFITSNTPTVPLTVYSNNETEVGEFVGDGITQSVLAVENYNSNAMLLVPL